MTAPAPLAIGSDVAFVARGEIRFGEIHAVRSSYYVIGDADGRPFFRCFDRVTPVSFPDGGDKLFVLLRAELGVTG